MTAKHGKTAALWLDALDLSPYANSLDLSADVDTADTTTFGSDWKSAIVGLVSSKVSAKGFYDPGLVKLEGIIGAAVGNILTAGPAGLATIGDRAWLAFLKETGFGQSSEVGGAVAWTADLMADGQVGLGYLLHALAAETADGNGSTYADLGTAAAGAVAHLHVSAVSSSDSIVVKLQDSADHSSWSDVSGGAFTSASAAGAQRLIVTGTLRRYVRASWDVTGTDPSITFGVAVARLP